ncbi:MAG TPA: hypothetical protein VI072_31535 [Polyangiaceae bacterium]
MSEPVILRVVRPYASEDEFLAGDLWTIDSKAALLIGVAPLDPGTLVRFDVVLSTGERVIRAEGKVLKYVDATPARPGGLRVRFTRFGGSTKAFIDRAVQLRRASTPARPEATPSASTPEPAPSPPAGSAPTSSAPRASGPAPRASEPPEPELRSGVTASAEPLPQSLPAAAGTDFGERRQVLRDRAVQQVSPPANRDALLDRLRSRARR